MGHLNAEWLGDTLAAWAEYASPEAGNQLSSF